MARNDFGTGGAGDRSGTVDGDLVPSAAAAEDKMEVCERFLFDVAASEGPAAAGVALDGVKFDLRMRRVGVNGFSAFRLAIASLMLFSSSFPTSGVAMIDSEDVGKGVSGLGGAFDPKVLREWSGGWAMGEELWSKLSWRFGLS
jgi:hypothetical protein